MKITNKLNLPVPVYDAIVANPYTKGDSDISVTDLIDSPKIRALRNLHEDDIEADASDLVYSLLGQAMHSVLERAGIKSGIGTTEQRLHTVVDGYKLSGQFDYIDNDGCLWDWKFVSVWEYINGIKAERERQLNCYAALAAANGIKVSRLQIGFIFRDWSKFGPQRDQNYPRTMAVSYPIKLWDERDSNGYINERIKLHMEADDILNSDGLNDSELVDCTPEERWEKPSVWAVMKDKDKRAVKLFTSELEADGFAKAATSTYPTRKYRVAHRLGESTRCLHYCPVLRFCSQGQAYVKKV